MAGSVYFWTDENGVRHYSNSGVPSDVQEADVRPEEVSPEVGPTSPEADVNAEVGNDAPNTDEGAPGDEASETETGSSQDARLAAKIEKERERLKAEIERIEGLAIGKSFTPGMKEARIQPLKEQLALLNADPERYFRMKRAGAFGDTPNSGPEAGVAPPPDSLSGSLEPLEPVSTVGSGGEENVAPEAPSPQQQE
jgi:hypothetical protein